MSCSQSDYYSDLLKSGLPVIRQLSLTQNAETDELFFVCQVHCI